MIPLRDWADYVLERGWEKKARSAIYPLNLAPGDVVQIDGRDIDCTSARTYRSERELRRAIQSGSI